jgi:hypothetical protein
LGPARGPGKPSGAGGEGSPVGGRWELAAAGWEGDGIGKVRWGFGRLFASWRRVCQLAAAAAAWVDSGRGSGGISTCAEWPRQRGGSVKGLGRLADVARRDIYLEGEIGVDVDIYIYMGVYVVGDYRTADLKRIPTYQYTPIALITQRDIYIITV